MTFSLHAAIESARRVEEARKRSLAAVHGQETRRDMSAAPSPLRNYETERRERNATTGRFVVPSRPSPATDRPYLAHVVRPVRMIVSPWSIDEFGNKSRTVCGE